MFWHYWQFDTKMKIKDLSHISRFPIETHTLHPASTTYKTIQIGLNKFW